MSILPSRRAADPAQSVSHKKKEKILVGLKFLTWLRAVCFYLKLVTKKHTF